MVAGIALLLCGLCLLLVGGGCTTLWLGELVDGRFSWEPIGVAMFAMSVAAAGLGLAACVKGVRLMIRK
jgi:hypothetical protein